MRYSAHCHEVEWQNTIQLEDETGSIWNYLPLGSEAQMFAIVTCRGGCGRSPHWIGVGSPFNDGKQYLLEYEAWCFWCLPREHFTEEELPLIRQADWAREQTKAEIVDFVRTSTDWSFDDAVKPSEVVNDIRAWF
jgi:hypothetical protein